MRKLPLVVVDWRDITTHPTWDTEDADYTGMAMNCVSVGWQLKSNSKALVITPIRTEDGCCGDRIVIPRGCIKKITKVDYAAAQS